MRMDMMHDADYGDYLYDRRRDKELDDMLDRYQRALGMAVALLEITPELEIRSALKLAGEDNEITYGKEMADFVSWAEKKLGVA